MVCRTNGVSDHWCVGPMVCRTNGQLPGSGSAGCMTRTLLRWKTYLSNHQHTKLVREDSMHSNDVRFLTLRALHATQLLWTSFTKEANKVSTLYTRLSILTITETIPNIFIIWKILNYAARHIKNVFGYIHKLFMTWKKLFSLRLGVSWLHDADSPQVKRPKAITNTQSWFARTVGAFKWCSLPYIARVACHATPLNIFYHGSFWNGHDVVKTQWVWSLNGSWLNGCSSKDGLCRHTPTWAICVTGPLHHHPRLKYTHNELLVVQLLSSVCLEIGLQKHPQLSNMCI